MKAVNKHMKPSEVVRCAGCGRLVEKVNAARGPLGLYGKQCLARAVSRVER